MTYKDSLTLTLWRCFNEDDGRGSKPGRNFHFFCHTPPRARPPDLPHAKRTTPRQATPVSHSWAQYIAPSICIWLITSPKTERACANRNTRLLDFVGYGSVRVKAWIKFFEVSNANVVYFAKNVRIITLLDESCGICPNDPLNIRGQGFPGLGYPSPTCTRHLPLNLPLMHKG